MLDRRLCPKVISMPKSTNVQFDFDVICRKRTTSKRTLHKRKKIYLKMASV